MASVVDQLRDRWESITPRERKLVVLLGASFVVVIVLWLAFSIRDGLGDIEHRNARMQKALDVLSEVRRTGPSKPADNIVETIGTDPVKLETYLGHAAESVHLTVPSFLPRTPQVKNEFTTYGMQIELRDLTVQQVKDYLEAIETGNRLVVVTSINLTRNFRDKEKLDMRLEISTYAKVAPKEGAGSGSGSGSGSASGTGGG